MRSKEWLAIMNPFSGGGISEEKWKNVVQSLRNNGFDVQFFFTTDEKLIIEKTKKFIEDGSENIIVLGGDGTINEVINGIMLQKRIPPSQIHLGVIPIGTANDWIKTLQIPNDLTAAINIIKAGKTIMHDVGWATYFVDSKEEKRFFINAAGTGLDSVVVEKTNQQKNRVKSSAIAYFMNLLKAFIQYIGPIVEVETDQGLKLTGKMVDFAVGNGRYIGGGMLPFPKANPTDGLLEGLFIKNITKLKMIFCFSKLYKGNLDTVKEVVYFKAKEIKLVSKEPIFLETDGETLGFAPFTFGIVPQAVTVYSPANFDKTI